VLLLHERKTLPVDTFTTTSERLGKSVFLDFFPAKLLLFLVDMVFLNYRIENLFEARGDPKHERPSLSASFLGAAKVV
jgi:hypothetical protein